jgi:hypothetical protein
MWQRELSLLRRLALTWTLDRVLGSTLSPILYSTNSRRNLARTLFNDFWSGVDEKPVAFVERLDRAEDYLNERLAASGEFWRLDANARVTLGLPPRSNSPDNGKNNAARG